MRKLLGFFLFFFIIICTFTVFFIFLTEKTDFLGLKNYKIMPTFTEIDGKMTMHWERYPYPCFYKIDTFYKTTGLVENSPQYHPVTSELTFQDSYALHTTAIPSYYRITAYGIFGQVSGGEEYIPNPNYTNPLRPIPISHYTASNPASPVPYLLWHSVPDGVLYELELLSGPPEQENTITHSKVNHLYATTQVFNNGIQIDLRPYIKYPSLYWRVRALNLRKEPIGVFSNAEPIYIDPSRSVPNRPLVADYDRMEGFTQPIYPVFNWIPMLGVNRYEVELMTSPPEEENGTAPHKKRVWAKIVEGVSSCYDEYPRYYAGKYYWRVRGIDEKGNTIGTYSDTESFSVEPLLNRPAIAVLGDSITHGGGAVSFSPADLEYSYLTYMDMPALNLGRSGDTSATTLERFEQDVLPIMPYNLLIMTGSNSLRSTYITADMVIADLDKIIKKCKLHDIRPIIMTLPPLNPDNIMLAFQTPTDPGWYRKMTAINKFIRSQEYYIDLEPYFYDTSKRVLAPKWANDGLHADIEGKMLIGEIINQHKHLFKHLK